MKRLFILALLCLGLTSAHAQSSDVDILDASLSLLSNSGTVKVYVSESVGISALQVSIGSEPDSSDVYASDLTLGSGGSFFSQGTLQDGVLTLPIGALSNQSAYYTRVTLTLADATTRTIAVLTAN